MNFHPEVLGAGAEAVFRDLKRFDFIQQFYLAGGTGLALQLGHRRSDDFDFFSKDEFNENLLINNLSTAKKFTLEQRAVQTILGTLEGVKISFFRYPYPLLRKLRKVESISLAHPIDIACMKIDAISRRGTKRDFIDLYVIANNIAPLNQILEHFRKKYKSVNYNLVHAMKSLVYFDDAEKDEMRRMLQPISWKDVKQYFRNEVKKLV